jgi:hypothetical protein
MILLPFHGLQPVKSHSSSSILSQRVAPLPRRRGKGIRPFRDHRHTLASEMLYRSATSEARRATRGSSAIRSVIVLTPIAGMLHLLSF